MGGAAGGGMSGAAANRSEGAPRPVHGQLPGPARRAAASGSGRGVGNADQLSTPGSRSDQGGRLMTTVQADDPTRVQVEFEGLLAPILQMAYGTAVRLTRDRTEAEDLVQDAALLAYRAFGTFQQGTNFKAWFFRILTNAFYSRHRKEKHEK